MEKVESKHVVHFQQGDLIGGRYEIISTLGEGGMGTVYRVRQVLLNKEFALKTLHSSRVSEVTLRRFQQEARASFALEHPSIISVKDFGVTDDGTPYLTMELLEGETLSARLKRTGPLPVDEAVPIFIQLCQGIAFAHERGIVHRDIKPGNIMLLKGDGTESSATAKILDFGIAKVTQEETNEAQSITRTGEIIGSPLYMSPEQCAGLKVDKRSDIYSLGCVFFEALTGCPPFIGENALGTMIKHQNERAATLRDASLGATFPERIERIIASMLEKRPEDRCSDLNSVTEVLLETSPSIPNGRPTKSPGLAAPAKAANLAAAGRKKIVALAISIACALILVIGVFAWFQNLRKEPAGQEQSQASVGVAKSNSPNDERVDDAAINLKRVDALKWTDKAAPDVSLLSDKLKSLDSDRLQLKERVIDHDSMATIASSPTVIHSIAMRECTLENCGLSQLANLKLTDLKLVDTKVSEEDVSGILLGCRNLQTLTLANDNLSDKGAAMLCKLEKLEGLDITGSNVSDDTVMKLAKLPRLRFLLLNKCKQVSDKGLSTLSQSALNVLEVAGTKVTDKGLLSLSKCRNLSKLNLEKTDVSAGGITKLCNDSQSKLLSLFMLKGCKRISNDQLKQLQEKYAGKQFYLTAPPKQDD
jgi:serine/threonine-protein kinase